MDEVYVCRSCLVDLGIENYEIDALYAANSRKLEFTTRKGLPDDDAWEKYVFNYALTEIKRLKKKKGLKRLKALAKDNLRRRVPYPKRSILT